MSNKKKIWYSFLDIGGVSDDDHIGFYNSSDFPWVSLVENNFDTIKQEIASYIKNNEENIKPYFNDNLVTQPKSWRTFAFIKWAWKVRRNRRQCPNTIAILDQIPNLVSASISILEPGVQIKPHRGDTNAIVRAHLGIEIPAGLPEVGFEVNQQKTFWEEGKVIVFNDAAEHAAWNHSNKRRYVMIIDVMRKEYSSKKLIVCSMILGSLVMQSLFQKIPLIKKLPRFFQAIILYSNVGLINLLLRFRS